MIRGFLVLLALVLVSSAACKSPAVAPANPSSVRPKSVRITIGEDSSSPGRFAISVDPESLYLFKRNHEVVKWCVVYNGPPDATLVTIKGFVKEGESTESYPFGQQPVDNVFDIAYYDSDCKKISKEAASAAHGKYKYTVVFKLRGEERGRLDPHVIIGD